MIAGLLAYYTGRSRGPLRTPGPAPTAAACMFGRTRDDLLPEVREVSTATDFFERTDGYDIVFV